MTYATLKTDVADFIMRSDLTTVIPTFVQLVESRIRRDVRVRDMETTATATLTAQTEALPSGFLSCRRMYAASSPNQPMKYLTPDRFWDSVNATEGGVPVSFTIEGANFVFAPVPSSGQEVKYSYFKAYDALSGDSDTNFILTNHYDVYLYGACAEAANYIDDNERAQKYDTLYQRAVEQVNKYDLIGRYSGPLERTPRNAP